MPVWRPQKGPAPTAQPIPSNTVNTGALPFQEDPQAAPKELDKFLSHYATDQQKGPTSAESPYGNTTAGATAVPVKFSPPPVGSPPPMLPGVIGAPQSALGFQPQTSSVEHFDPEVLKLIEDMGYFGLAPLYSDLARDPQTWQAAIQLKELVKRAAGMVQEQTDPESSETEGGDHTTPGRRRAVIDVEPLPSDADRNMGIMKVGATSDAVLASLVEKVSTNKGALPPLGAGNKINTHYIGKLVGLRGVSPNISVFQDFKKDVGAKMLEIANRNPLNLSKEDVERQVIAANPDKFDIIRRIRDRSSAAFSTYGDKNPRRRQKDGDSTHIAELIKGNYHGIECRVDVRDFLTEEARGQVSDEAAATARVLYLVEASHKGSKGVPASAFKTKDTIGRKPIALVTSLTFETPSRAIVNYGNPNIEYPRADSPCFVITYRPQKKSDLFLVESFPLLYTLLRDISVDEVVGYLER